MNGKERIEAIIAGKETDRMPFAVLDAGAWAEVTTGLSFRDFLSLDDDELEDELNHLLDYAEEANVVAYEQLREAGVDIAWFGEPVASGAMISQSMFEEFALEPIKRGYERLRKSYKYILMHMCGNSGARVSSIKDIGLDAFSVDAMVDLKQAGIDSEGKMVIIGNISPSDPLQSGTPVENVLAMEKVARES